MRSVSLWSCCAVAAVTFAGCGETVFEPDASEFAPAAVRAAAVPGASLDVSDAGQLAFVSGRDGDFEIYVANPDGSEPLNLTRTPGDDREPAWSPDGARIAFNSTRDGDDFEIYVMDADAPARIERLTTNSRVDRNPAWSPDGTRIAYRSGSGDQHDIYVVNADGTGAPVRLTSNSAFNAHPTWSPDGTRIAFTSDLDGDFEIYAVNADGSAGPRQLTDNSAADGGPDWSPDGRTIAFHSDRDGDFEIFVMNADGSGQTPVTADAGRDAAPDWSPGGTHIVFGRDGEVYVMRADGTAPIDVSNHSASDFQPAWGPRRIGLVVRSLDASRSRLGDVSGESYSFASGPGFGLARSLLAKHFPGITFDGVPELTAEALEGADVFVINELDQPLSAGEICALETFVDHGGALLETRNLFARPALLGTEPGEGRRESTPEIVDPGRPPLSGPFDTITSGLSTGINFAFSKLGDAVAVTANSAGPNIIELNAGAGRAGRAVLIGDDEFFMTGAITGERSGQLDNPKNQMVLLNTFAFLAGAPGFDAGAERSGCAPPPNVAPSMGEITAPTDPVAANTAIEVGAPFTDPDTLDTHTAMVDWGDGTVSGATVTEANGSGSITAGHAYAAAGAYGLTATVQDDDGGVGRSVFQYVVVYDPGAGFVTGDGWIESPAGAYAADPTVTGKAKFNLIARYRNGADTPTGHARFRLHAAKLTFRATSYDWLLITGARARYAGMGALNGTDGYAFTLTAIDGALADGDGADALRITIRDVATGNVVYDNQMGAADDASAATVLGGGSIVIHEKKP